MNHKSIAIICLTGWIIAGCERNNASTPTDNGLSDAGVFPQGDKITNDNFTGTVYLKTLVER